jgi:hypothetical protein
MRRGDDGAGRRREETKGKSMKKLLMTAAAGAIGATALMGQVQAGPAADPMCKMAPVTGNSYAIQQSWADHYGCWPMAKARPAAVVHTSGPALDPMCKMAAVTGSSYAIQVSWAENYGCWGKVRRW